MCPCYLERRYAQLSYSYPTFAFLKSLAKFYSSLPSVGEEKLHTRMLIWCVRTHTITIEIYGSKLKLLAMQLINVAS